MAAATTKRKPTPMENASAVVAAAAGLATTVISTAATEATRTLAVAAADAAKVVEAAAAKAVADFPRMTEDIREIRNAQESAISTMTSVVTNLLDTHSKAATLQVDTIRMAVEDIKGAVARQANRVAATERHTTRLNLVVFGMGGPFLIGVGYVVRAVYHAGGLANLFPAG